jgi:tetratricopeptide (TPR) repeat protein
LGVGYLQKADFEAAMREFRAALKTAPDDATLHYNLGLALKLNDQLPGAVDEFQKAAQLDPSQADVRYTLGVTLWQQGEFAGSADALRAAIKIKPDYAEAYYTLGTVLKQEGNLSEAAAALHQALRLQPDFAGAHTTLAAVLRQLGDTEGAAAEGKLGAEIAKSATSLQAATFSTNSGRRLLNAGDIEGAISQFRVAIQQTPTYAAAHFYLGQALLRKGLSKEASAEFQKASELDPRFKNQKN